MYDLYCDRCQKLITDGTPYISFNVNKEVKQGRNIQVVDAVQETVICETCYQPPEDCTIYTPKGVLFPE